MAEQRYRSLDALELQAINGRGYALTIAAVALANKMARTAWAMMRTGEDYRSITVTAA
jgi:hypothetical protein